MKPRRTIRPVGEAEVSSRLRPIIVGLMVCISIAASGCATTLGYIPEVIPVADKTTYVPTYAEVKKWARDVEDGYDSRAILNRNAIYAGAFLGAAAVGAIAGLAAFDTGSSALIGIPIGTGFLASVAAIYNSEEKARIYGNASETTKRLIRSSDQRLRKRKIAAQMTAVALAEAEEALNKAVAELEGAMQVEGIQKKAADSARAAAERAQPGAEKDALSNQAQAAQKLALDAKKAAEAARVARDVAQQRSRAAADRHRAWQELLNATRNVEQAKVASGSDKAGGLAEAQLALKAAERAWEEIANSESAEASCLREDIEEVMRKVREHLELLDPKSAADRLRAVREAVSATGETERAAAKLPPVDLSDLREMKSHCEGNI